MKHLPNALTLINLVAGASGIFFLYADHTNLTLVCAVIALLADVLDGMIARAMGVQSKLGVQLDSLADVVSFGVLPSSILAYDALRCDEYSIWMAPLAMTLAAATALRLAKFNLDTRDHSVFYGLPSPTSAVIVFALLLVSYTEHPWAEYLGCQPAVLIGLIVLLPLLMLSDLRLWSLKGLNKRNGKVILGSLIVVLAVSMALTGTGGILVTAGVYLLLGLLNRLINVY